MRNITNEFKKAIDTNVLWGVGQFSLFLEVAGTNGFDISFWDGDENWATLSLENNCVGYIWKKYPLVLLSAKHKKDVKDLLPEFEYIVSIFVADLDSEELIINDDQILIDRLGPIKYHQPLSASDIWFSTIT